MALEFTLKDFFHPVPLARRWHAFRRSQYFAPERLAGLQDELLRGVVRQAATQVPYYRDLFRSLKLAPDDIRTAKDLAVLPPLTKATIHAQGERLYADDRARWRAKPVSTSGTSGKKLVLLMDTPANVLEFNYYLRFWAWRGYRLGLPFAELSTVFFQKSEARRQTPFAWSGVTRRLLLNSVELSEAKVRAHTTAMRERGARFLKGLPSVLYHFALFCRQLGIDGLGLKAVFSQGELLQPQQRRLLEEVFGCKVADSYGHMERTIAISECEHGRLHGVSDYGLLQLEPASGATGREMRLYGTGLYNMSMPLLRYDVGDLVTVAAHPEACPCGRHFPQIEALVGRQSSSIRTPDGRVITAAFLVFEDFESIEAGSLAQTGEDLVVARIAPGPQFGAGEEARFRHRVESLLGPSMRVAIEVSDRPSGKISA